MANKNSQTLKLKLSDVEKTVVELAKKNIPSEKIGLILRDQHGIPKARLAGKKISQILKENNMYVDSETQNIEKKVEKLQKHFANNKHDYGPQRRIVQYRAKLNKIKKAAKN